MGKDKKTPAQKLYEQVRAAENPFKAICEIIAGGAKPKTKTK